MKGHEFGLSVVAICMIAVLAGCVRSAGAPVTAGPDPAYPPVEILLSSAETVIGQQITYPGSSPAHVTAVIVTMAPGDSTGWHEHGAPLFAYLLEGELRVDYGSHGTRIYTAGDSLLEAVGAAHDGHNIGDGPVRVLAVFMGAEGVANSTPVDPPETK
jgi:quercetin dioxygenase-like cupin family protein